MKYVIAIALLTTCAVFGSAQAEQPSAPFGTRCYGPPSGLNSERGPGVGVKFNVGEDGTLQDVTVEVSSQVPSLDTATVECVSHWRIAATDEWRDAISGRHVMVAWLLSKDDVNKAVGRPVHDWPGRPHVCTQVYPLAEAQAGIGGRTAVEFRIKTDGSTDQIHVVQSSGNGNLDKAAVLCVSTWRYKPAMQNGVPIEVPWKAEVQWAAPPPAEPVSTPAKR